MGRYQSGQLGQTVNLLAFAFVGSNPTRPKVRIPLIRDFFFFYKFMLARSCTWSLMILIYSHASRWFNRPCLALTQVKAGFD